MTRAEVLDLVNEIQRLQSELSDVEVKAASKGTPKRLFEPLSALANRSGGGVILFGLDEAQDFDVLGVGNVHLLQEEVGHVASADMEPALRLEFTIEEIVPGKSVVVVEVPEVLGDQKPCYHKSAGLAGGAYIRVGNTNRQMTDYEIFGYLSTRNQPTFDEDVVPGSSIDDLDMASVEDYIRQLRQNRPLAHHLKRDNAQVLQTLRIAKSSNGVLRPTLAGLLIFGFYPQAFEPQLVITFLQYYGVNESEPGPRGERFIDNQKFEGPIPQMIEQAVRYVMAGIRKSSLIEGLYRRDIPEYPEEAIREAVVNAVVHRDYSNYVRGSQVQIKLFLDRLEIQSPGGLYGNVTEDILEEAESTRNRYLMRLLEDLHIAENRGSGIDTMLTEMRNANLGPPLFFDRRLFFRVTFRNHTLMNREAVNWLNQFSAYPLNDRQRLALVYLRRNERLVNNDYRRLNHIDSVVATKELKGLVQLRLLEQHGTRGGAYYTLGQASEFIEEPESIIASTISGNEQEAILAYVKKQGSINNKQCRVLLNVNERRANYLLTDLCAESLLHREGKVRWTRYVIP